MPSKNPTPALRLHTDFPDEFLALFRQVVEPGPKNGCWPWPHHKRRHGYGHFYALGCTSFAHRTSFAAFKEDPPAELEVRHKCDNPPCWRPDHLILGTHADNMGDAFERNRTAHGDRHGCRKLSEAQIPEIVAAYLSGATARDLGSQYGVAHGTMLELFKRKTWRRVTEGMGLDGAYRGYEHRRVNRCVSCSVSQVERPDLFRIVGEYENGETRLNHQCTPCRNADDRRWRAARRARDTRLCSMAGCDRRYRAAGLCRWHYDKRPRV